MQSLNLVDYIKVYNTFEQDILENVLLELQNEDIWSRHMVTDSENNYVEREGSEELYVSAGTSLEHNGLIMSSIYNLLYNYIKDVNIPQFHYWQGYSSIRFNRYKENQIMSKHFDRITSIFDGTRKGVPILSIVGLLNDNFAGGEFIMFDNYKINLKAGDVLIFPSSFNYPHKVNPVTKGTRYSFVSWAW